MSKPWAQTTTKERAAVLKKATAICQANPEMDAGARAAWERIWKAARQTEANRLRQTPARFALLQAIADGSSIADAEAAGMAVLT